MEEQLLPRPELAPAYDKVVWLYVYRDFSKNEADLAAERICLRFGFTAYPQHYLLHPVTLERMTSTDRSIESFLGAVEKAKVGEIGTTASVGNIAAAEKRAAALEKKRSVKDAVRALDEDDDIVVRFRAVEVLKEKAPKELVKRAADLLKIPNDPLRYIVCGVLQEAGDASVARILDAVVEEPKDSLNPNVLRMNAVRALATCGDVESVAVVGPQAIGPVNNGLRKVAVDTLAAIAARHKKAKKPAVAALAAAYPEPWTDERWERSTMALAKHVHATLSDLTGKKVKFPKTYDAESREKLTNAW